MRTISQRELRNDSAAVLREVQRGESFVVTRNGTPVASLASDVAPDSPQVVELIERLLSEKYAAKG